MEKRIDEKIKQFISEQLCVGIEEITDNSTIDSLGADSLDRVELIMNIEDEYHLNIPDNDADKLGTCKDLIDYIKKQKGYDS